MEVQRNNWRNERLQDGKQAVVQGHSRPCEEGDDKLDREPKRVQRQKEQEHKRDI